MNCFFVLQRRLMRSHAYMTVLLWLLLLVSVSGQQVIDDRFDHKLQRLLSFSVPVISPADAHEQRDSVVFLDSREYEEYTVSHIPSAVHVGYDDFDINEIKYHKNQPIVVYCSVGYRSEKIAERLIKAGYTDVRNMYGSLFEWANCGLPVINAQGMPTDTIHTYNRRWSKWLTHPDKVKVW